MISFGLAQQLHVAGITWNPTNGDLFVVPGSDLQDQTFVISEQSAFIQKVNGVIMIAFHGTSEWALDHVIVEDVVWLPTETQLRTWLVDHLPSNVPIGLQREAETYTCTIGTRGSRRDFTASKGEDAYGMAVLHVIAGSN
ncbi:MAG: hypothetical protein NVSMB42_06250 [Herpetosiphon sp.]